MKRFSLWAVLVLVVGYLMSEGIGDEETITLLVFSFSAGGALAIAMAAVLLRLGDPKDGPSK